MRAFAEKKARAVIGLAIATVGVALAALPASGATTTIDLCAKAGTLTLPAGVTVNVWGYALKPAGGDCSSVVASIPGPVLDVPQGNTVTVNVTNALPAAAGATSFEVPGQAIAQGSAPVAMGATQSYTFTAGAPGTYLYQSPAGDGRQIAMGLYGALIVRPAIANQAYGTAASAYNSEQVLVLSAIDPAFNAAPSGFDMHGYAATYWLINGKAYPQAPVIHGGAAGQKVLLRYVNAGFDNTTMTLVGPHQRVIARDAHLVPNAFDAAAETIPAGATEDTIVTVPSYAPPNANGFPLYNRQLHVTNGAGDCPGTCSLGGMLTFLQVP